MSKNYNRNWEHLTQMKLKLGDLVIVKDYDYGPNGREEHRDMCIVVDLDLHNKGYSFEELNKRFSPDPVSFNFVKQQHNGKAYRYVGLHNPRTQKKTIFLFHPTYEEKWSTNSITGGSYGWTTPALLQEKENERILQNSANAYVKKAKNDWIQKYGEMKEYKNYIQELHKTYGQGSRHRSRSYQYDCALWCLEKEKKELYEKYSNILIDVIDNRWDHNPKSLRGMIEDAIPLAQKDNMNIDVRIGHDQIQYDISFIHDQEYKYNFISWDMDERDTEYNNIISNCPSNIKPYVEDHISCKAEDFWGTNEWYNNNVKNSFHHSQRYRYTLQDKIE
tara:strand:+ start:176 stop:1174 length:999 start_codon:yes stop_codon:yes gene_type:complete